jgi:hypothetical protein
LLCPVWAPDGWCTDAADGIRVVQSLLR